MNQAIQIGVLFSVISILSLMFFLIPNSAQLLSFSGQLFFSGEIWRIITFPFSHVTGIHLMENIAALVIASLLAYEFDLRGKQFILVFMLSGILIAITTGILAPPLKIAGASMGIYAVLGTLSIKGSNFIKKQFLLLIFGGSIAIELVFNAIFCPQCITLISMQSSLFHFTGFIMGIGMFYIVVRHKKRRIFDVSRPNGKKILT